MNWPVIILHVATIVLVIGCHTTNAITTKTPVNFPQHRAAILTGQHPLMSMTHPGPFSVTLDRNYRIQLNATTSLPSDVAYSSIQGPAPLIIIVHGNGSHKDNHRQQISHLASWGFHAMAVQLPNRDHWLANGQTTFDLVKLLYIWPDILAKPIDINHIMLAGHSFGASAVSLAAARGAPVRGLILLDPALFHRDVAAVLPQINVPVMIIGADEAVFRARRRQQFFRRISGPVLEASINSATHNDAQWPTRNERWFFGIDLTTSRIRQQHFAAIMTMSAVSMTTHQQLGHTQRELRSWQQRGILTRLENK